jgi:hypothetical protein
MSDSEDAQAGVFGNIFARDTDSDEAVAAAVGAGVTAAAAEVRIAMETDFAATATISTGGCRDKCAASTWFKAFGVLQCRV